jgi:hypothetical protein
MIVAYFTFVMITIFKEVIKDLFGKLPRLYTRRVNKNI